LTRRPRVGRPGGPDREPRPPAADVSLRAVGEGDVGVFYGHQADPEGGRMAAFAARDPEAHFAHWERILRDPTVIVRTIVCSGEVVGNVVSWIAGDRRAVGYWIGRSHWGRGIATRALGRFLELVDERPLWAFVAKHNAGSIRVLEKCGFSRVEERVDDAGVAELVMRRAG